MPDYRKEARRIAQKYGVPPELFESLIEAESGFNAQARSGAGAQGLTQLMPATARGLGVDPNKPIQNLEGGARYLKQQLDAHKGNRRLALASYNAGPGAVAKYGGVPPYAETQAYVKKVLAGAGSASPQAATGARLRPIQPTAGAMTTPLAQAQQEAVRGALRQALAMGLQPMQAVPQMLAARRAASAAPTPQRPNVTAVRNFEGSDDDLSPNIVPVLNEAKKFLGTPYSWGGGNTSGPSKGFGRGANTVGFDCSSFLQYLHAKRGVAIPRVTYDQFKTGKKVGAKNLKPGDAVFFNPGERGPEHVGMYLGGGQFIESPKTGDVIKISKLSDRSDFMGGRRYSK